MVKKKEIKWENPFRLFWVLPYSIVASVLGLIMVLVFFTYIFPTYIFIAYMIKGKGRPASLFLNRLILNYMLDCADGKIIGLNEILSEMAKSKPQKASTAKSPPTK